VKCFVTSPRAHVFCSSSCWPSEQWGGSLFLLLRQPTLLAIRLSGLCRRPLHSVLALVTVALPCKRLGGYQRFGGTYCLHLQDRSEISRKSDNLCSPLLYIYGLGSLAFCSSEQVSENMDLLYIFRTLWMGDRRITVPVLTHNTSTEKTLAYSHGRGGIRTHYPSVRTVLDSTLDCAATCSVVLLLLLLLL
jgi:hypothetical protein